MKILWTMLLLIPLGTGCRREEPPRPVTAPAAPDESVAAAPEKPATPGRIPPEAWLNHPTYKKPNPYDLPLEYNLDLPELPPAGLIEPCEELLDEDGEGPAVRDVKSGEAMPEEGAAPLGDEPSN